ncbi:MFS superfamily [Irpex lacteus]|nr:MFS superfamily [Irpex lacteus]
MSPQTGDSTSLQEADSHNMEHNQPSIEEKQDPGSIATATKDIIIGPGGEPSEKVEHMDVVKRDFYLLPIPKYLRYDPNGPTKFDIFTNILFGIASTCIIANLYYCQPLLIELSKSFHVTYDEVSRIPTLVQAGYCIGLLFISPLGDLVRRRPLILLLVAACSALTIGLPITSNVVTFEIISFFVGAASVVPQVLLPLAADLAPPHKRASAISVVFSGLLLGILFARVMAGVVANFVSWRIVYWIALGVQGSILVLLYLKLPDYPAKNRGMSYFRILYGMGKLAVTEPLLIQSSLINLASMACFTNFWVTLTFLLGGPIYNYNTLIIGLFGLVGMAGVAAAPLIGRTVDRVVPWFATVISVVCSLAFYSIQLGAGGVNIAAVVIVAAGIDMFRQSQQVSLLTRVFELDPNARARLNSVMVVSLFIGQIMGTAVGTRVFNAHGWRAAAALSVGWQGFCLLVILVRGPHCQRYTWFGYEGGYSVKKPPVSAKDENN